MSQDVRSCTIDQTPSPEVYLEDEFSDHHDPTIPSPSQSFDDDVDLDDEENDDGSFAGISHHNVPPAAGHFVGDAHDSVLDQLFSNLIDGEKNPFTVLLGGEGLGKSTLVTAACHEVLDDDANWKLFEDGILYLDLLKWHRLYQCSTLEQCLILALQQCGLDTFWIEQHDDWNVTTSNVFEYVDRYLARSLIILEDFDRFKEESNLSLDDCHRFLFRLFENLSFNTKVVITARQRLPIFYNFNQFKTAFFELSTFTAKDAVDYIVAHCHSFSALDIEPHLDAIRDVTAFKPLYLHSLYKLWQNIAVFESSFEGILSLYRQMDHPLLIMQQNPFNALPISIEKPTPTPTSITISNTASIPITVWTISTPIRCGQGITTKSDRYSDSGFGSKHKSRSPTKWWFQSIAQRIGCKSPTDSIPSTASPSNVRIRRRCAPRHRL